MEAKQRYSVRPISISSNERSGLDRIGTDEISDMTLPQLLAVGVISLAAVWGNSIPCCQAAAISFTASHIGSIAVNRGMASLLHFIDAQMPENQSPAKTLFESPCFPPGQPESLIDSINIGYSFP